MLIVPFSLWLAFALAINWMGAGIRGVAATLYEVLALDVERLSHGEVWRLLTAPFLHIPSGVGAVSHILTTLLLLYFFGAPLQSAWGNRRFLWVLFAAALGGELLQLAGTWLLPVGLARGVAQPVLLGGYASALACMVAWGASHRNATVYLFFAIPVRGWTVVILTVAFAFLNLIAVDRPPPEGILAPFGGMLVGYLLGGSTPSPLRKAFLRWKLRKLEASGRAKGGGGRAGLRVVPGGREAEPKRDGRWLN